MFQKDEKIQLYGGNMRPSLCTAWKSEKMSKMESDKAYSMVHHQHFEECRVKVHFDYFSSSGSVSVRSTSNMFSMSHAMSFRILDMYYMSAVIIV